MNAPLSLPTPLLRWQAFANLMLVTLLLIGLVALPAPVSAAPRVHDALLALAGASPAEPVTVIIRHDGPHAALTDAVTRSGGRVLHELGFINALVAEVRAGDLPALGSAPGVTWISPDAPMVDHAANDPVSTSSANSAWVNTVGLKQFWEASSSLQGQNVGVAILDSGVIAHPDLQDSAGDSRVRAAIPVLDNLVLNGGFEDGANQWSTWTNYAVGLPSRDAATGSGAMFLPRRQQNSLGTAMSQSLSSYIPGDTYTLSVSAKRGDASCESRGIWVGVSGTANGEVWGTGHWFCDTTYARKSSQFTIPANTDSLTVFMVNNSTISDYVVDDLSIVPVQLSTAQASSMLVGSPGMPPSAVNVASEGGLDWMVWNGASRMRRSGVPARIQMTQLAGNAPGTYSNAGTTYSWSGGTPTASGSSTTGISFVGAGSGVTITAPATTSYRTLRVYMTLQNTELSSTSFLNDGSTLPQVDTSINTNGVTGSLRRVVYTYTFKSDVDARQLTVQLMNDTDQSSASTVAIHAIALSEGSTIPVSTMTTVANGKDQYGHGTLIAGLIGGDGRSSSGQVMGVAPRTNLVSVRVLDANGEATVSDVIRGMEWIYKNRTRYNIRVLNMSLNSSVEESYHTSPLSAAAEILWMNGIVVVVSAGNNGANGKLYPPANDPFVITVGATDDRGTGMLRDDGIATFSARGTTEAGTAKPEILAPGVNLTSLNCATCFFAQTYRANIATGFPGASRYFRASGTSLSAAVVTGAAALLIQKDPSLNPDQIKHRLTTTGSRQFGASQPPTLNVYAAVNGTSTTTANTGLPISQLLFTGDDALTSDSARWGSARWGSARWGSARWGSTTTASSLRTSVTGMAQWPLGPFTGATTAQPPERE